MLEFWRNHWVVATNPDRFQDIDLVKETQDFYKKFYDYDLSADEVQRIIDAEAPAK